MENFLPYIKHVSAEPAVRNLYRNQENRRPADQTAYNRERDKLADFRYDQQLKQKNEDRAYNRERQLKQDRRSDQLYNIKLGEIAQAREDKKQQDLKHKVASVVYASKTPESWKHNINRLRQKGINIGPEYDDFSMRESVLAEYADLDHVLAFNKAQTSTNNGFKVPSGFMSTEDGRGVVPIPGGPKDLNSPSRIFSDGQIKSASFANRMKQADDIMIRHEDDGYDYSAKEWLADTLPLGGFINRFGEDESQSYKQAQEDWVRAKLRRESGAAIGKDEMAQEKELYFPQMGDSKETILQKRRARVAATENLKRESQGAYDNVYNALDKKIHAPKQALDAAHRAIKSGKDPELVKKRLLEKYGAR